MGYIPPVQTFGATWKGGGAQWVQVLLPEQAAQERPPS